MLEPQWTPLVIAQPLDAPRAQLWVRVCPFVRGPRRLLIQATGAWYYDSTRICGPDGNPADGFSDANLHKSALRGCLLLKVGGSTGDTPAAEKLLAAGSYFVFDVPDGAAGPLFATMNDDPKRFHLHSGSVIVTIAHAPI
jgi:hypothetical protein